MCDHLVLFDCDGVLVDSETLSAEVLATMAAELGLGFTHGEALAFLRGRKVAEWVAELGERAGRPLDAPFVDDFRSRAATAFDAGLVAIPGVEAAIGRLAGPFCTASSAPLAKIRHTLGLTGLLPLFEGRIYSAYEVGAWKPDPRLFLHAAADMGADPADCAVIEDSLVGVQAGVAAGMTVFAYAPADTGPALARAGATPFACMSQLPALLGAWRREAVVEPGARRSTASPFASPSPVSLAAV